MIQASFQDTPPELFSEQGMTNFIKSKAYSSFLSNTKNSGISIIKGHVEGHRLSKYSGDGIEFNVPVYTPR